MGAVNRASCWEGQIGSKDLSKPLDVNHCSCRCLYCLPFWAGHLSLYDAIIALNASNTAATSTGSTSAIDRWAASHMWKLEIWQSNVWASTEESQGVEAFQGQRGKLQSLKHIERWDCDNQLVILLPFRLSTHDGSIWSQIQCTALQSKISKLLM